ncbi:CPBP family intramembrane glutamic endopeptidase [Leptotrichia massiliensis]|uniref:CPBP family intramembrane glutamic endopeptidase n=1 Tax=Leptotrichia massiliensis TaxID=1852388 RepID=UPI0028D8CB8D|nr:CPBP family intramembrane glutamic endopeptidase [Leptotrichia massiliensis]
MYFFRIDKFLFCISFLYYFIKNNKEYKYFKVNETLSKRDFNIYFALIFWINIALDFIISIVSKIYEQDFVIERPLYLHIVHAICIAPILEEIIFRGVIMNNLKKYGIKIAIISNSILFGLSHYNIDMIILAFFIGIVLSYVANRYSIKYSILMHILINMISKIPEIGEASLLIFVLIAVFLLICYLFFFISGLIKKSYKDIFSIFKLNNEDRKNIVEFVKNNGLYLLVILAIAVSSLLLNYKLF